MENLVKNKVLVSLSELEQLAKAKLQRASVDVQDIDVIIDHLLTSEKRGYSSHGLTRLPAICKSSKFSQAGERKIVKELPGFIFMDGAGTQGIATVSDLLEKAARSIEGGGSVVAAASGFVGTTGCLGVYTQMLASKQIVSISFCHSECAVAPHGSAAAILGTNPISIGFPGPQYPFVADIATSAWSYGALKEAMNSNERIPFGIVQSANGKPSQDPNDADNGSQLPMSGHKGYGLGLAVELICGPFLGGKAGGQAVSGSDSYLTILLKASSVRDLEEVYRDVSALYKEIKQGPFAEGYNEVLIPGERAFIKSSMREPIYIDAALLNELRKSED